MENLHEFIKPELLLLVPVLYFLGNAIKASPIKDWLIPYILGGCGILLCLVYVVSKSEIVGFITALEAVFTALTQGILVAGMSVYLENLIKQTKKAKEESSLE